MRDGHGGWLLVYLWEGGSGSWVSVPSMVGSIFFWYLVGLGWWLVCWLVCWLVGWWFMFMMDNE